jgi:hypothetical protein
MFFGVPDELLLARARDRKEQNYVFFVCIYLYQLEQSKDGVVLALMLSVNRDDWVSECAWRYPA